MRGFGGESLKVMLARQKRNIELAKKTQGIAGGDDAGGVGGGHEDPVGGVPRPAELELAPLDMLTQGPQVVALRLAREANCAEEQMDAVALLAHSLQKRFERRPDKTTHGRPVATRDNNHRAI